MKLFMLVDCSPVVRKVANRILSDLGFVVVEATDGVDALEKCNYNMPDAIIVDWELPEMSGSEFIQEIRKIPESRDTKIMFCTSEILVGEMTRAKRAGANGFLLKPFNREVLIHKLAELNIDINSSSVAA